MAGCFPKVDLKRFLPNLNIKLSLILANSKLQIYAILRLYIDIWTQQRKKTALMERIAAVEGSRPVVIGNVCGSTGDRLDGW